MTQIASHNGASRRRWLSLVCLLGVALLAVSMLGSGWMMHSNAGSPNASPVVPAGPAAALYCIGTCDVPNGVSYPYPTAPGRVIEVKVREGQAVKAGDLLFRLDDRAQQNDVAAAANAVQLAGLGVTKAKNDQTELTKALAVQTQAIAVARANLDAAQFAAKRKRDAAKKGGLVEAEADAADLLAKTAEATVKVEEAKLEALQARADNLTLAKTKADAEVVQAQLLLDKAKLALDECAVKAPADGTVLRLSVQAGDLLSREPKTPALIFCPAGPRIVRAEVEQEWASRVQEGQIASIQDDTGNGSGPAWTGRVVHVGDWMAHRRSILPDPSQLHNVRTLECMIEIDPNQTPLRIGQRVRVALSNP